MCRSGHGGVPICARRELLLVVYVCAYGYLDVFSDTDAQRLQA